jgi:hypothetical protein
MLFLIERVVKVSTSVQYVRKPSPGVHVLAKRSKALLVLEGQVQI